VTDDDPDECGDVYTLTAMESETKLFISHNEGSRSADDATSFECRFSKSGTRPKISANLNFTTIPIYL
jgi:hypothetical protein